jgi:hypothetical protein
MNSRTGPPNVAIQDIGHCPDTLLPLLASLRRWCQVFVMAVDSPSEVDAVIVLNADTNKIPQVPYAIWVESTPDVDRPAVEGADVVMSTDPEVLSRCGRRGLYPPNGRVPSSAVPIGPFVRGRLRKARGLPSSVVVEHDGDNWWWPGRSGPMRPELVDTALGCASAAIVIGPTILRALSWGTPVVTDADTAATIGANDDVEVIVADEPKLRRSKAQLLASEPVTAARISWAGRMLVERRHDARLAAATLVRRLNLGPASALSAHDGLALRLAELGTPANAHIVERANDACSLLPERG